MKPNYLIASLVIFLVLTQTGEAQLLKKLKNKIERKVENVIVEKASDKAAEKTSNTMDKVFDMSLFEGGGGKEKADPGLVADSYDFTWKYSLKMTTKDGDMVFDYYLKPDASYFGFTSAVMESMFTVMDNGNKVTAMFMESEGNNIAMVSQMPDDLDFEEAKDESSKFTFEQLPDKSIMGFNCKGVKATNDEFELEMYFTNETEVSFDNIYKSKKAKIPVQFKDYFDPNDKVLMIYMDMKNLKNKKESATMECIGLEEVQKSINKSDYKFM